MKQKPIPDALMPYLEGKVLLLDKPIGWTSFDLVKKVRNLTRVIKVGQHTRNDLLRLIAKRFKTACYSFLPYREVRV